MRTQILLIAIFTIILGSACQKQVVERIDDTWRKVDITSNPGETIDEVWIMSDGKLSIMTKEKDGEYITHSGGTYKITTGISSNLLVIENCPLAQYNAEWSLLKQKSNYFVITKAGGEFSYLEFQQYQ